MKAIQGFTRRHFVTILLLFVAGGFFTTLAELILTGHTMGPQLIGVVASALGIVLAALGIFAAGKLRITTVILFLVLAFSGVMGMAQHLLNRGPEGAMAEVQVADETWQPVANQTDVASGAAAAPLQDGDGTGERAFPGGPPNAEPPPLAPLALSGLALMGAVVLLAKRDPDEAGGLTMA